MGVLGASWAGLGPSWAFLGGPRGGLGGSWGRLGSLLEASWGVLGGLGIVLGRFWATNAGKRKIDDSCTFLEDSVRCAHGSSGLSSAQQQPADLVLLLRSVIGGVIYFEKQEYCPQDKQPRPEQGKLTSRQKVTPTAEEAVLHEKGGAKSSNQCPQSKKPRPQQAQLPPSPGVPNNW